MQSLLWSCRKPLSTRESLGTAPNRRTVRESHTRTAEPAGVQQIGLSPKGLERHLVETVAATDLLCLADLT